MNSTERDLPEDKLRDLIEQLRASAEDFERPPSIQSQVNIRAINAMHEAADALASIRAERDAAVAALKPFADAYRKHDDPGVSDLYDEQPISWHVPLGAYRRARAIAGEQTND